MTESSAGVGRLSLVVVDCPDAVALADFYAALLGVGVKDSDPGWVTLEGEQPGMPALGAKPASDVHGSKEPWRTYTDPAGHPFCLVTE
jgi:hypothetical protein